jgi:Mg2+ and Co2+ transporter CorA
LEKENARLKQSIREGIPAAAGLMETISDSKDKRIAELEKENENLKDEIFKLTSNIKEK